MGIGRASLPDWQEPGAYAPLLLADRTVLAWEWLRRVPSYRRVALREGAGHHTPSEWGLHRFEHPDRSAPAARPIWTADWFDGVLAACGVKIMPHAGGLGSIARLVTATSSSGGEHVLISDGWRVIRVDFTGRHTLLGATTIEFVVPGPPLLGPPLLALQRFEGLTRTGDFVGSLHRPEPRAGRELLLLRTADALAAGEGQRAIAATLIDPSANSARWRDDVPHLRLQAQRLVRDARARLAGGYRTLLRRSRPSGSLMGPAECEPPAYRS